MHRQPGCAAADPGRDRRPPRCRREDRDHRRHRDPGPAAGRRDRDRFVPGKNKQNAVRTTVVTDGDGRVLLCSPTRPGSCADTNHARRLGLVELLADGPAVEILTDAGYQGLGAQTGGRAVTPPHRKFKKNAPDRYEEMHERRRKAHSSRRIRVEHGIAHLENWRALTRHLGRREHISDTLQAVAGLPSHQQTADLTPARQMWTSSPADILDALLPAVHELVRKPFLIPSPVRRGCHRQPCPVCPDSCGHSMWNRWADERSFDGGPLQAAWPVRSRGGCSGPGCDRRWVRG
ncbi:transposase family protein [Streptomyces griseomycini]|uniref:transposase family protein n=1 Tax=Streptomyces griseomycini TaxID=66895 RepID=UPI001E2EB44E|nr:transposase family protein [Streptomyces griseomycini]